MFCSLANIPRKDGGGDGEEDLDGFVGDLENPSDAE